MPPGSRTGRVVGRLLVTFTENRVPGRCASWYSGGMTSLALVLFLAQPPDAVAAERRPIRPDGSTRVVGTVLDTTGLPLFGAAIRIDDALVAVSDPGGRFEIAVVSGARYRVVATLLGFDPRESVFEASHGARLDVVLAICCMRDQVTVTAPSPEEVVARSLLLEPVRVYRTPGAYADFFRALQPLPGASAPDDAAGLFVRGGEVSEVLVSLDDAVVAPPYRHETPIGEHPGAPSTRSHFRAQLQYTRLLRSLRQRPLRYLRPARARAARGVTDGPDGWTRGRLCLHRRTGRRPIRRTRRVQSNPHRRPLRRQRQPTSVRS